jgi:CBS domain-containing protein
MTSDPTAQVTQTTYIADIAHVIRGVAPVSQEDSLAKAVRLFRARAIPMLVVAHGPHLVGLVHESDVLRMVAKAPDPVALVRTARVDEAMRPIGLVLSSTQPLAEAAAAMAAAYLGAAPVVDGDGRYLGLLLRRDLLAAIGGEPLAPVIAGLATPLGVHLTTGTVRAGAGDLGLALTGAVMMAMNLLSVAAVTEVAKAWPALHRLAAAVGMPELTPLVLVFGQVVLFLLLLRFSPIPGIHAGEHMVVHAIEAGEDLTLEKVRPMPRAHPRCGTNLMALLVMVAAGWSVLDSVGRSPAVALVVFAVMIVVVLTWRRLGYGLQRWITTRTPSDRQLQRAVGVGQELLRKIGESPGRRTTPLRRFWNIGFLQVLMGAAAAMAVGYALHLL